MENNIRDILIGMIDDGLLDARTVAIMCVKYMSCDDVSDMMGANDLDVANAYTGRSLVDLATMDRNFK